MRTEIWRVPAGTGADEDRATRAVTELRSPGLTATRRIAPRVAPPAFRNVAASAA